MKRAAIHRQEGLSYTEVLVSVAVISIAVFGFSVNTVSVIRGNLNSTSYTVANNLAQDKLEQLSAIVASKTSISVPIPVNTAFPPAALPEGFMIAAGRSKIRS